MIEFYLFYLKNCVALLFTKEKKLITDKFSIILYLKLSDIILF